ncbi:MAG TPA: addiction module protein [Candidatus Desulfobacillus sp.]|nr:addiction module protein [Candidatus Desulfobacillus sp.]
MVTADIVGMPVAERLKLMETLWDSLCAADAGIASPAWHGEVLTGRLRRIDSGADAVTPWKEAKERIRNQVKTS